MTLSPDRGRTPQPLRNFVTRGLTAVEDIVYVGLGLVLAATALCLLFFVLKNFVVALVTGSLVGAVIGLLDQVLLILLIIELLYTVQVSFCEHTLVAEPFLVVALIATVRKILVLTTQISQVVESDETVFRHFLAELGLLAFMVLVLVGSLVWLQRHARSLNPPASAVSGPRGIVSPPA